MAPIWYVGFPVTIPLSAVIPVLFWQLTDRQVIPEAVAFVAAFTALIYAVAPPALIVGGLLVMLSALLPKATTQPAAATKAKAKAVAAATQSGEAPASTAHSGRDVAGPRRQSDTVTRTRVQPAAAAVPKATHGSDQNPGTSKKSSTSKRAVGGSGRDR
ncbi:hypothetical protein [Mycolicibacterium helvum]|uniref:hypothetical protein n=1 Tax=Mycolicibacterium helvum TaxID=1534349 RepID=UPI0013D82548|nr:hypothetical protein [Mycolicibacterium helvum]